MARERGEMTTNFLLLCDVLTRIEKAHRQKDSTTLQSVRDAPGELPWMRLNARLNAASVA